MFFPQSLRQFPGPRINVGNKVLGIVIKLRPGRSGARIPAQDRNFPLPLNVRDTQAPIQWVPVVISCVRKAARDVKLATYLHLVQR